MYECNGKLIFYRPDCHTSNREYWQRLVVVKADLDNGILADTINTWETFSHYSCRQGTCSLVTPGGLGASLLCLPGGRKEINQPEPLLLRTGFELRNENVVIQKSKIVYLMSQGYQVWLLESMSRSLAALIVRVT